MASIFERRKYVDPDANLTYRQAVKIAALEDQVRACHKGHLAAAHMIGDYEDQVVTLQATNAALREQVDYLRADMNHKQQHAARAWALKRGAEDDLKKAHKTMQIYIDLSAKQEARYWTLSCLLDAERAAPEQVPVADITQSCPDAGSSSSQEDDTSSSSHQPAQQGLGKELTTSPSIEAVPTSELAGGSAVAAMAADVSTNTAVATSSIVVAIEEKSQSLLQQLSDLHATPENSKVLRNYADELWADVAEPWSTSQGTCSEDTPGNADSKAKDLKYACKSEGVSADDLNQASQSAQVTPPGSPPADNPHPQAPHPTTQAPQKKKGPSHIAAYKQKLACSFRRSSSFEGCEDDTPRQVNLGPNAAVEGLAKLGFTAWDEASKVVQPYQPLLDLQTEGLVPGAPVIPSPAQREAHTCVVPFWTKAEHFHIFVPKWGDINVCNCEILMATIPDQHRDEGANKQDLALVVLRAAFVVFVNTKLLPWMHYGDDLNMSCALLTQSTLPPTPHEACHILQRVYLRSRDGSSLDAFLAEAGRANPKHCSDQLNDEPAADATVDGQKWKDMSPEQQDQYMLELEENEGVDKICAGLCGTRWHGSKKGPSGLPEAPVEKVVVFHCPTCERVSNGAGGHIPLCMKCAKDCCTKKQCPLMHSVEGASKRRVRHLPYFALEKCINMAMAT